MDEKGGAEDKSGESLKNSINSKIILTAIMTVLIGMAFILMMIFAGVQISQKYEQGEKPVVQKEPEVEQVIELEHTAYKYEYGADSEYSESNHVQNLVFEQLDVKSNYILIDNTDRLAEVVEAISRVRGSEVTEMPNIEDDFFTSGVIIAVGVQDRGLSRASVEAVHRDANYNIFVTMNKVANLDTMSYSGVIFLIKLPNIQPKTINVSVNDGMSGV